MIGDGNLLRRFDRAMQIQARDGHPKMDFLRCRGKVQRQQQWGRQVTAMGMDVVLGEPRISDAQRIGHANDIRRFGVDFRRRSLTRTFQMIGQTKNKHDVFLRVFTASCESDPVATA